MYNLNAEQKRAVESNKKKILCLAGAGTGKTRTMIERIVRLVDTGVSPRSILALTFTNAAAFEMKSRYREYKPDAEIPEFRTFHSFCYDLLSSNRLILKRLGFSSMPMIAEEFYEKKIEKQAIAQTGIKFSEKQLADPSSLSPYEKKNYEILQKAKNKLLKSKNMITFDDLCNNVCDLFIKDDELIQQYKERFKYIHVDEYQDTDKIQDKFVMSFIPAGSSIFLVGDALQNLYSFRGSDSSIIKRIAEDPDWQVIRLTKNYRSTKEICEYANNFSKSYAKDTYRIPIESNKYGSKVEVREQILTYTYGTFPENMMIRVTTECKAFSDKSIAVLCRTNVECKNVQNSFKNAGLNFVTAKQSHESVHILHSAADDTYMTEWLSTFLNAEKYSEYIRLEAIYKADKKKYAGEQFMKDFGSLHAIAERAEKIYEIRRIAGEQISLENRGRKILDLVGYPKLTVDIKGTMKVSKFLEKLWEAVSKEDSEKADIYIGTIHSVKGLEYDLVYVLGVDGKTFPLDSEDNNNVFYVAITRAKEYLVVYEC
ncbi:MAG: ATP-dependent helicase [Bacteroidaceae bacterium]|nr:ATP-dependent helicase [Bacteroidaceae bacterium]